MLTAPQFGFDLTCVAEFNEWNVGGKTGRPVRLGVPGIGDARLTEIEAEWEFQFPPDLRWLLASSSDPQGIIYRWEDQNRERMKQKMDWPLDSMLFDVEHDDFWMPRWGEMPVDLAKRFEIVRNDYRYWPRLIPVFSHRYISSEPCVPGNPVYSVYQTDVIFYGANLIDYLRNEFSGKPMQVEGHIREIEPWHSVIVRD